MTITSGRASATCRPARPARHARRGSRGGPPCPRTRPRRCSSAACGPRGRRSPARPTRVLTPSAGRPPARDEYTSRSRESLRHVVRNGRRVERLTRRLGPRDPRPDLEARRAGPRADRDFVLHAERRRPHPRHPRPDRQHVAVARRAHEPRPRLDDGHADDRVLRECLGPRESERREERLAAEVVPLEEARVEDDARRVHVAPSYLDRRRVLDHVGKRFCFQSKRCQKTSMRSTIPWNLWRPSAWAAQRSSIDPNWASHARPYSAGSAIVISSARKRREPRPGWIQNPSDVSSVKSRGSWALGARQRKKRALKRIGLERGVMKCDRYRRPPRSQYHPSRARSSAKGASAAMRALRQRSIRTATAASRASSGRPWPSHTRRMPLSSRSSRTAATQNASAGAASSPRKTVSAPTVSSPWQRASAAGEPSAGSTLPPGKA